MTQHSCLSRVWGSSSCTQPDGQRKELNGGVFLGGMVSTEASRFGGLLTALAQVSVTFELKCDCGMSGHARVEVLSRQLSEGRFWQQCFFSSNAVM